MKKITYLFCSIFVLAAITACSPDEPAQSDASNTFTLTVQASKGGGEDEALNRAIASNGNDSVANNIKRILSLDGHTLNAMWAAGEKVTVYNVTKDADLTGSLTATNISADGSTCTLTGSLTGDIDAGDELLLKFLSPDYDGQDGTLSYIATHCDYAEASVSVASTEGDNVTTSDANFQNKQAIVRFKLKDKNTGQPINAWRSVVYINYIINWTQSTGNQTVRLLYTFNPASATDEFFVAFPCQSMHKIYHLNLEAYGDKFFFIPTKYITNNPDPEDDEVGPAFENGKYYEITLNMNSVEGAILGRFTCGINDDFGLTVRVIFSKGNLQYIGSAGNGDDNNTGAYWKFADHQWDCFGRTTAQGTDGKQVDRDLFCWGATGIVNKNHLYQPWEISSNKKYFEYAAPNWGENVIGNNEAGAWSTPSWERLDYILNTRVTPSGVRYARGLVNGTEGLILLPDEWDASIHLFDYPNTGFSGDFPTSHVISAEDWAVMENAGAVFLPAAGCRTFTDFWIGWVGEWGYYWLSNESALFEGDMMSGDAEIFTSYSLYFGRSNNSYAKFYPTDWRNYGYSVRLIREVL